MKLKLAILLLTTLSIFAQNQRTVIGFDTVADMVRLGNPKNPSMPVVDVSGYRVKGDGGGGTFIATNTVTSTNLGTRIYSGIAGWSWERIINGNLNIKMFGAYADGMDDSPFIQATYNYAGSYIRNATVEWPAGLYGIATTITISNSWVATKGPNWMGGAATNQNIGATLRGLTSGMTIMRVKAPSGGIYKTLIAGLRFTATSGLASKPTGLELRDSSESEVWQCVFAGNLGTGILADGTSAPRIFDVDFNGCEVGIHSTVLNATLFQQGDIIMRDLNIFNSSVAAIKFDSYLERTIFDGNVWIEDAPIGIWITPRAGTDMVIDALDLENVEFFNGTATPYPGGIAMRVEAPAGSANYLAINGITFNNFLSRTYGGSNSVEFLLAGNSNANTAIRNVSIIKGRSYEAANGMFYVDDFGVTGTVIDPPFALVGYQTGAVVPSVIGDSSGFRRVMRGTLSTNTVAMYSTDGIVVDSPASFYNGTNFTLNISGGVGGVPILSGKADGALGPVDIRNDASGWISTNGIVSSSADNANPTVMSWANGDIIRAQIALANHNSPMDFRSFTTGSRMAGWQFSLDGVVKVSIDTNGTITANGVVLGAGGGGSAPVGTMVNSGASTQYAFPYYNDTTGTNMVPSLVGTDVSKTNIVAGGVIAEALNITTANIGTINLTNVIDEAALDPDLARDSEVASTYAPINNASFTGTFTAPNDTIALGTKTTGNYAASSSEAGPATSVAANSVTGAGIAMGSDVAGDIIYYNGTDYVRLPIGTAAQVLTVNAGATAPEWAAASGGTTYTNAGGFAAVDQLTTSATAVDATGLSFSIGANEVWSAEFYIAYTCETADGAKAGITAPAGATVGGTHRGSSAGGLHFSTTGISATVVTALSTSVVVTHALIQNGATPGTVQYVFASGDGVDDATIEGDMSYFVARRIQ